LNSISRIGLLAALVSTAGCYASHRLDGGPDSGAPHGDASDASDPAAGPCTTICDAPRVLAHADAIGLSEGNYPVALLDAALIGEELVAIVLYEPPSGSGFLYYRVRMSLRTGDVVADGDSRLRSSRAVTAASVRAFGTGTRLVALRANGATHADPQDLEAVIATWVTPDAVPSIHLVPITTEPIAGCVRCARVGAAIVQSDDHAAIAVTTGDSALLVDVDLASLAVRTNEVPIAGVSPDAPLSSGVGSSAGNLFVGGGSLTPYGSAGGLAFAIRSSGGVPMVIPGRALDPAPVAVALDDELEVVRFLFDDSATSGELVRFRVVGDRIIERARLSTAGGLPPRSVTSTAEALLWAEPDLATSGAANLRVLVHGAACTSATASTVVHLPAPLLSTELRVLEAAYADGRTYAMVLEDVGRSGVFLTAFDLGICRAQPVD
jgi:hypothetical protein